MAPPVTASKSHRQLVVSLTTIGDGTLRFVEAGRVFAVNGFIALLILISIYVRHWSVLVLWAGLLAGFLFLPLARKSRGSELGFLSFLGWLILGSAIGVIGGQVFWIAFTMMGIVWANYIVFDWERPPPAPSRPTDPAFGDPIFSVAAIGLFASGLLVLLALTNNIPDFWLGPACGASGLALGLLALAMARWRIGH